MRPLYPLWSTNFYRLFGPAHPGGGRVPLTRQTITGAFEPPGGATFAAGEGQVRHGGPGRSPSRGSTSVPMAGRAGGGPDCTTGRVLAPGRAGPFPGRPARPAPCTCRPRATDTVGRTSLSASGTSPRSRCRGADPDRVDRRAAPPAGLRHGVALVRHPHGRRSAPVRGLDHGGRRGRLRAGGRPPAHQPPPCGAGRGARRGRQRAGAALSRSRTAPPLPRSTAGSTGTRPATAGSTRPPRRTARAAGRPGTW